ncbi:hypothetical protein DFJ73DRAFT_634563, partial [Zopfochytrium polystomum]
MLPSHLAISIAHYLDDPRQRLILATLFRLDRRIQVAAFVALHRYALDVASARNDVPLLRLLAAHFKENEERTHKASRHYTDAAMDRASEHGHVDVLDWWKDRSGLALRYSLPMDAASAGGHVAVLRWWKDSGLPVKLVAPMDVASTGGHVEVLRWWKDSGLKVKYTDWAVDSASAGGHVAVLQWWKDSGYRMKYTARALDGALRNPGSTAAAALEWWAGSGLDLR